MRHFNKDYVVDEYGRLFSLKSGELKELKPYVNQNGYLMYRITMEGKTKQYSAHHLSYWCNVGSFDTKDGLQIDHIDGNKLNNHYSNLRRVTQKENSNNINTVGELTRYSRSNFRLMPTDRLPSSYSPKETFSESSLPKKHFRVYKSSNKVFLHNKCVVCSSPCLNKYCLDCYNSVRASSVPSRETLEKELKTGKSLVYLSSLHGVSDNAYRKWLKKRELPYNRSDIKQYIWACRQEA